MLWCDYEDYLVKLGEKSGFRDELQLPEVLKSAYPLYPVLPRAWAISEETRRKKQLLKCSQAAIEDHLWSACFQFLSGIVLSGDRISYNPGWSQTGDPPASSPRA